MIMKKLFFILMAIAVLIPTMAEAQTQKKSKREIRAEKKAAEAEQAKIAHDKALKALEANDWAFETKEVYNSQGKRLTLRNRPNVVGSSGKRLVANLAYGASDSYIELIKDGPIKKVEKKQDKRGNWIYKFYVNHPFAAEVTVILTKDSNAASITVSEGTTGVNANGINSVPQTHHFSGFILPAEESHHYKMIRVEN